jgi:hypothetical protein
VRRCVHDVPDSGDLNFAHADGKLLVMVNFGDARLYSKAREQKEMTIGDKKYPMELFAHAVTGVGDEAFTAPPGPVQCVIYGTRGTTPSRSALTIGRWREDEAAADRGAAEAAGADYFFALLIARNIIGLGVTS